MAAELTLAHPPQSATVPARRGAAPVLMLASGGAGLGDQVVWTQQGALWLGHESAAVLAVVTAFFGGLALGALGLARRIERSPSPQRWYAGCELLIALWSLVLALMLAPLSQALLALVGPQPAAWWQGMVTFVGTGLLLLPATAAMGATLPAMARMTAGGTDPGTGVALLYACNTAGALIGVLATAFWLVPELGLTRTALLCAALNGFCAVVALRWPWPARPPAATSSAPTPLASSASLAAARGGQRALALLAATGALGIGFEVLVVRVLSQVAEDTVYTFALLLAVYLAGTAAGAAGYRHWAGARAGTPALRRWLLTLQALACLVGTGALWGSEATRQAVQALLGSSLGAALGTEALLALAAFLLPTLLMGALFSQLCDEAQAAGQSLGRALGVNTLGAAVAPLLFGLLLAPVLGAKAALLILAACYLLLAWSPPPWARASHLSAGAPPGRPAPLWWVVAAALAALAVAAPPLAFIDVPEGGRIVSYREGAMASVSVVEDAHGVSRLRINNRQQEGSSASVLADARQALLPLLLHPAPRKALFLGLGTGVTASAAAAEWGLQVDAVELLPDVIAASAHFAAALGDAAPAVPPRLLAADARRFVRTSTQRYDIIVADNYHPARSGSGALYTVEHFRAVRERLADQGLFCQWLPLHQLDLGSLRSIVRAFLLVYPQGGAVLATNSLQTPVLGLVARADGQRFELRRARERLATHRLPQRLDNFGIADELALFGGFVAGPQALARFAAGAPLNTDDRPVVAYRAPRLTYAPDSQPHERLQTLLDTLTVEPGELVDDGGDEAWSARWRAYRAARDRFLAAGQQVRPLADPQQMLAQVQAPLLDVLQRSPDFRPAYDPLLRLGLALARSDPAAAQSLLRSLQRVQPARPEAGLALARLAPP